jgi:signal transduction histidine kinase
MLLLLGDQLIRDAGVAVFELVKNAYDADATMCRVTIHDPEKEKSAKVTVEDDGEGMDFETVGGIWLEPGTDYRAEQRLAGIRSKRFRRLPLDEKGVGRFAVHKLGGNITLVSRRAHKPEVVVEIDWSEFGSKRYLSDVPVSVKTRVPVLFTGKRTGTWIEVSNLREPWTRGKVRNLYRAVASICSPFHGPEDFKAELLLKPNCDWLSGVFDVSTVLDLALFRASGVMRGDELKYTYEFTPLPAMIGKISGRKETDITLGLKKVEPRGRALDLAECEIGEVVFDFSIFDREPEVLELSTSDKIGLKQFLDQNGGVRVYRDGVRVYDFGEPGNDWLGLGGRRVNIPTVRVSNNQIIGAVSLAGGQSTDLREKTNREGFIENYAYDLFQQAVLFALTQVEAERKEDKERLREQYSRKRPKQPVIEEVAHLRRELEKRGLTKELGRHLDTIEKDFLRVREQLLTAAGPGLMLTTVIHEVEKIIKELTIAVRRGIEPTRVRSLVENLAKTVEGLAFLIRKSGSSQEKASILIQQALFNTEYRLKAHGITVVNGLELGDQDFSVRCTRRLIVSTLMNLIDNAIYWLERKNARRKMLYIGTTFDLDDKPALLVADNGPGFIDPPDYLVQPFFTRKPDGMGLGLHVADEIAKLHKGHLLFPDKSDVSLPRQFTGAIVAFQFAEEK